jgi:hypothetical protein
MTWKIICGVGFLFLIAAIFTPESVNRILLSHGAHAGAPTAPESSAPEQTQVIDVTLHPYDLLQHPFMFQNKVVIFDVVSRPRFFEGSFYQYADGIIDSRGFSALTGLKFRRMLSQSMGLYELEGVDSGFPMIVGQIVVTGSDDVLATTRFWEVEPLGTVQTMNYVGAAPDIPIIKFWAYAPEINQGEQQ